jgi:hypothetical protein
MEFLSWTAKWLRDGRRGPRECPLAPGLPTGVARGRRAPVVQIQNREKFWSAAAGNNALAASFWPQSLHWNNSRLEKAYCIQGV